MHFLLNFTCYIQLCFLSVFWFVIILPVLATLYKLLLRELFPFDMTYEEPAVVSHEIKDGIELFVYEAGIVAHYCHSYDRAGLNVLMIYFGN